MPVLDVMAAFPRNNRNKHKSHAALCPFDNQFKVNKAKVDIIIFFYINTTIMQKTSEFLLLFHRFLPGNHISFSCCLKCTLGFHLARQLDRFDFNKSSSSILISKRRCFQLVLRCQWTPLPIGFFHI